MERTVHSAQELTVLLNLSGDGDTNAARRLMAVVYDELRHLAGAYLGRQRDNHTLQPTALVHEAFLKLIDQSHGFNNRAHFFAVAAKAMRHVLVDHARARKADKRGGDWKRITLDQGILPSESVVDIVALDDALESLAALDERQAQVVEMRYFGGLSVEEAARVLGVSKSTVEADWRMARAWLSKRLSEVTRG